MLTAPSPSADAEELADHLELTTLCDPDGNSSITQIVAELDRTGAEKELFPDGDEGAVLEGVADAAFRALDERSQICGEAYPFSLKGSALISNESASGSLYVFLLLLSRLGGKAPNHRDAAKLFEEISALAACSYLGSDPKTNAHVFGFPRRKEPKNFGDALKNLCENVLRDGEPRLDDPLVPEQKDGRLDVVAWKEFPDKKRSRIIAFGQCATGADWEDKAFALKPVDWSKRWLRDHFLPDPLACFFVPRYILEKHWRHKSIEGGLLFDRFRIAALSNKIFAADLELSARVCDWNKEAIPSLN